MRLERLEIAGFKSFLGSVELASIAASPRLSVERLRQEQRRRRDHVGPRRQSARSLRGRRWKTSSSAAATRKPTATAECVCA